jgi:autotransporter-associated beta strand protein
MSLPVRISGWRAACDGPSRKSTEMKLNSDSIPLKIRSISRVLAAAFLALSAGLAQAATISISVTNNTSGSWTCPAGVTSVTVEMWGGGGGGGGSIDGNPNNTYGSGGGGGGGAYTVATVSVTPGTNHSLTVGAGGTAGSSGNGGPGGKGGITSSTFPGTTAATGGLGGGGANSASGWLGTNGPGGTVTGTGNHNGGNGAAGVNGLSGYSGGGGGSGAASVDGGNAGGATAGTAGPGGGAGAAGRSGSADPGLPGNAPGGAGSGAYSTKPGGNQKSGGAGGAGRIVITYTMTFVATPYYSKGSLDATLTTSWTNASGASPADFFNGGIFYVQNGHKMTLSQDWALATPEVGTITSGVKILSGGSLTCGAYTLGTGKLNVTVDSGGLLQADTVNNDLGTGLLSLNGGTLTNNASSTLNNDINVAASSTVGVGSGQTLTLGGAITNTNNLTLAGPGVVALSGTVAYAGNLTNDAAALVMSGMATLGGIISGSGALTNISGTQMLSGANTYRGTTTVSGGKLLINGNSSAVTNTVTVRNGATFGGTNSASRIGGRVTYQAGAKALFAVTPTATGYSNSTCMTFASSMSFDATEVHLALPAQLENGTYALAANDSATAPTGSGFTSVIDSGSVVAGSSYYVALVDNSLVLKVIPIPQIIGSTNFVNAFSTTNGTASAAQSFPVAGTNLVADITATAAPGFEVSSDGGATYGPTVIVANSSGNASGAVSIRLAATAAVRTYNSMNIAVLSSLCASNGTCTSSASGNAVVRSTNSTNSIDAVDTFHGTVGAAHLFPTVVRPFGLASIGPNWKNQASTYSCAHVQGTGGITWNYLAPNFALTTGPITPDASAWTLPVAMDQIQYEGRADALQITGGLGYTAKMVATLRGGMVVVKSTDGRPLNVLFPVGNYNSSLKVNSATRSLIQSNGVWIVEGVETTQVSMFGRFEFRDAPQAAGTWTQGQIVAGPATVTGDANNVSGIFLTFPAGVEVCFRLGVSFTDQAGARTNLAAEIPDWDADRIQEESRAEWQQQLDRVITTGGTTSQRRLFYTALYQVFLAPHVYEDVDGRYLSFKRSGVNVTVRTLGSPRQHQYATFSGWDTFRTQMPLLALVEPERYADMGASLNEMGEQVGLPRWPLANLPKTTMVGNPIEHILATGRSHGIEGVDYSKALALMQSSMADRLANNSCLRDDYNGTVAIAALAGYLGQEELAGQWWSKTLGYRQFYDPAQKVFPGVSSAEGGPYTYVWYNAMWDPEGLATLLGGYEPALGQLRGYFKSTRVDFKNENDLHTPFIATLWGDPGLTRSTLKTNLPNMFQDSSPQGRSGNDDCGTMSAWLVLVQSGLYSFNPAWGWYVLTAPAFPRVELDLGRGGKRLVITANSTNAEDVIQQVEWDGVVRVEPWLLAADICNGGQLDFTLGPGPSAWAKDPSTPPLPFPGGPLTWNGIVDGTWDTTTTNWSGFATRYAEGIDVRFDDSAAGFAVSGSAASGSVTFSNTTNAYIISAAMGGWCPITKLGSATVTFTGVNTYSGPTIIRGGTLALGAGGAINNTTNITIAAGGALDVSAIPACTLSAKLNASGAGTAAGSTAAVIKGGSTVSLAAQGVSLAFTPASLTGDAGHPSLVIAQGDLNLGASGLTVTASGTLGVGDYLLLTNISGVISGSFSSTNLGGVTFAAGTSGSLIVSAKAVTLRVTSTGTMPRCRLTRFIVSGTTLSLSATNGSPGGAWTLLQSTNVALPLNQWETHCTGTYDGNGNLSTNILNATTNKQQFYILQQ